MFLSKQALPQPHGHSKARILAKPTTVKLCINQPYQSFVPVYKAITWHKVSLVCLGHFTVIGGNEDAWSWPCFDTALPAVLCKSSCSYAN